jgi:Glycosyltransferase WbsX
LPADTPSATDSQPCASVRAIAHYLPQFYPNSWNDRWWGKGFTEWINVARARPLYPGHDQPKLPGELGFYDLRLPDVREAQARLAREYGVSAFCYWHYWFGGDRRMLERPFEEVLAHGSPDFPFCLAWANHSWTGAWHGAHDRILIQQSYPGDDDYRRHFETLVPAFHDPRYVRVEGHPLFIVYVPELLPDPGRFVDLWRRLATEAGLPGLFLVARTKGIVRPSEMGFDAAFTSALVPPFFSRLRSDPQARYRIDWLLSAASRRSPLLPGIYSYKHWSRHMPWLLDGSLSFPTVLPNWDNTPRAGRRGVVFEGATPELFRDQVRSAVQAVYNRQDEHRLVFIQSWNEWAEGNYLEPDRRHGRGYLEALRAGLNDGRAASECAASGPG